MKFLNIEKSFQNSLKYATVSLRKRTQFYTIIALTTPTFGSMNKIYGPEKT